MKKFLISAPPPTANGDLHLGHLSGPFLRADILTRYLRMRDAEVYCVCGADEHQSYVAFRAEQLGITPSETVDRFSEAIRKTLEAARINVDIYMRPSQSKAHIALAQEIFMTLYRSGKFVTREAPALYCQNCEQYLFEVYVCGQCPNCGTDTCGNGCEVCGHPNDCTDLKEPVCHRCGTTPVACLATRLYFPLGEYEQQLRTYYQSAVMNSRLRTLCEQMLAQGLPEIPMSYHSSWGIPIPIPGFENQRINVWFEVGAGLLAATQALSEKFGLSGGWKHFWQADDVEVVQFCGFDNGFSYAMLIPAIFLAYDAQIRLAKSFLINEFYHLDGLKFSTSRDHAIWGRQLLRRASPDTVRFYLALTGPETEQTNFTIDEFEETVQRELMDRWQNWLHELGLTLSTDHDGIVPAAGTWTNEQHQFYERLHEFITDATAAYEPNSFSPRRAATVLTELVRAVRRFAKTGDPQKSGSQPKVQQTSVALQLAAAQTLAILSAPIMPDFSAQLWRDLGNETPTPTGVWKKSPQWVASGARIDHLDRQYFPVVHWPTAPAAERPVERLSAI
jgi:methionyl-tRNA synthetase